MPDIKITPLAQLAPGRIFFSGRLYVVETIGSASKARPWGSPPGSTKGCVTLSPKSSLARFYPVVERGMVIPKFTRSDFLVDKRPTAYVFETEKEARLAASLDSDLVKDSGLNVERLPRMATWLLSDGSNPYRAYHYYQTEHTDQRFAEYCVENGFVHRTWPDDKTQHWTLLLSPDQAQGQTPVSAPL
ncbi:MAG: hypothetical protein JW850_11210 [Thermoflexales bacterium]|nr:hypothetical protein [Thermoflexales bacterium]